MSNTMNVSYMTRVYKNFLKNYEAKNNQKQATAFRDKVAEKSMAGQSVSETGDVGTISTKDMTMEEYKQYIHDKISQLPMNPSHLQDSISINISEAGFEAMKNDPEYEKWVIDGFRADFATTNPWAAICGGCYVVHYIGAAKEECHSESWSAGYMNGSGKSLFDSKAKDSFWERRVERKRRMEEQQEKKRIQKEVMEKRDMHRRLMSQWAKEAAYTDSVLTKSAGTVSKANDAYEANFLLTESGLI